MLEELSQFFSECQTPFHLVHHIREKLIAAGFIEWKEESPLEQLPPKSFVVRDERAIVAFNCNGTENITITAAHSDHPVLKLKENCEQIENGFIRLRVNTYGGATWYPYVDRNLRLAGRVFVREGDHTIQRLFDSKKGICVIPSIRTKTAYNLEEGFNPIFGFESGPHLKDYIAKTLSVSPSDIVDWDLRLIDSQPPTLINKYFLAQGLDDLIMVFQTLKAFLSASPPLGSTSAFVLYDNEEIGSGTRCGARSNLLQNALKLLAGPKLDQLIAHGLFLSCDVNHSKHPNQEKGRFEPGEGLPMTMSPDLTSTSTDVLSFSIVKESGRNLKIQPIFEKTLQEGSTLGPYVVQKIGILGADIGQGIYAMHSIRESTSINDIQDGIQIIQNLFDHLTDYFDPQ